MTNDDFYSNSGLLKPPAFNAVSENQRKYQWTNNESFYSLLPAPYRTFYYQWVKLPLQWYDGFVPWVHGGSSGLMSTNTATAIVNRAADLTLGGDIMFANKHKPVLYKEKNGKKIGQALDFIANKWAIECNFNGNIKCALRNAYAGGFSLLKLNKNNGELWVDNLRADRFFVDKTSRGDIRRAMCVLAFYDNMSSGANGKTYCLLEDRYYKTINELTSEEVPVVEYKIYDTSVPVQYFDMQRDSFIPWEQLPKAIKQAFKAEYGGMKLNQPQAMNGFSNLGVYIVKGSEDISNVPQVGLGESLLSNILNYLYEFDFWNTAFNMDMYLGRGRVLVPAYMQNAQAAAGNDARHKVLEDFAYQEVPSRGGGGIEKPEPVQFALRAEEWKSLRNTLLENICTNLGLSPSSLAGFLQDGAQRTAREVSAEESATTLFVEAHRRIIEVPINAMIKDILTFYGYTDGVEIRWTKAGMTNQTLLVENLTKALSAGLIDGRKAYAMYNFDDDEEQINEGYEAVQKERAAQQNNFFGDSDLGGGDFE